MNLLRQLDDAMTTFVIGIAWVIAHFKRPPAPDPVRRDLEETAFIEWLREEYGVNATPEDLDGMLQGGADMIVGGEVVFLDIWERSPSQYILCADGEPMGGLPFLRS